MKVNFKKLSPSAVMPYRADSGAAGYDLTAVNIETEEINNNLVLTCHTGLAMEIPEGYAGFLFPRSSIYKLGLTLANSVGVIDSSYRGEIMCKFKITGSFRNVYNVGERCCQLVIMPVNSVEFVEQDELNDTTRGNGGFGSTGI